MKKSKLAGDAETIKSGRTVLDDSPAHLLHRVLQIALDIYTIEMGEGALTQRQYALLQALDGAPEGMTQTDLVRATGIDRSTLADLVARMLAKKLLARERSASDARANMVRLDVAGKTALAEMQPRVLAADEKILSLLSPPKRSSFVKLLRKIAQARADELIVAAGGEAPARKKGGQKGEKKKKGHKKEDKFARKLKKLPMPPLSEGVVAEGTVPSEIMEEAPDLIGAAVVAASLKE
ncbi:MAG: MarR family winged helix-turn-helix transcriptional regulator [Asticcacaulis sp.]